MTIAPLPAKLPGNPTPGDKLMQAKINELVAAVNMNEIQFEDLDTRLRVLEGGEPPPPPPPVPVASVTLSLSPSAVVVGKTVQAVVTLRDMAGNVLTGRPITYSAAPTSVANVDASGLVTTLAVGTATVMAVSGGISGVAGLAVTDVINPPPPPPPGGIAELPRSVPAKTLNGGSGFTHRVAAGGDLQAALDTALPGDVILMAPGATFTGNYVLPQKPAGTSAIELRTEIPRTPLDAPARRVTPTIARALNFARLVTADNQPALRTVSLENPTKGWILSDFEVTGTLSSTSIQYGLVALGDDGWTGGGGTQTLLARVPLDFVLDRLYIHGSDALDCTRGVALNSAQTALTSCWIGEIHSSGFDSQACAGWNGPGPYLLDDCTFEGAGENVMFGGSDPNIPDLRPSDITITRCHFPTPLAWVSQWQLKNPFELKNACRVLLDSCVFDHSPIDGQSGMALVIKSSGDVNAANTRWQGTTDVTVRYCRFRKSHRGLNLQAVDGSGQYPVDTHVARVVVEHCTFEDIGTVGGVPPMDGWLMLLTHDLTDIDIRHNTFLSNTDGYGLAIYLAYSAGAAKNLRILDNVLAGRSYYAIAGDGGNHKAALDAFAGTAWDFRGNVVSQIEGQFQGSYPAGNRYLERVADIWLAADGSLLPTSPHRGTATDGGDPGANVVELGRRTAGVVVP